MGYSDDYLEHHGILGQKWGVRRFENAQGHLTAAGLKRYEGGRKVSAKEQNAGASVKTKGTSKVTSTGKKETNKEETPEKKGLTDKQKKMIIAGAAVVGTVVAAYGGYKLYQLNKEAKEGLSNDYHQKARDAFSSSNKMMEKGLDLHETGFKLAKSSGADQANKMMSEGVNLINKSKDLRETGYTYQDIAKSGKFSVGEKAAYLKLQKAKASNDDNLKAKKEVTKVLKDYNNKQISWYKNTLNLESQKKRAERNGDTDKVAKIEKKLASSPPPIPPQFSKKGQTATNKLASEASALAKSVTAEGPKSFSSNAQNGGQTKSQMTQQKLQSVQRTISSGSKTTSNTMKIHGQEKFNNASKANDDLVQELLKKNTLKF